MSNELIELEVVKWVIMGALGFVVWWLKSTITRLQDEVDKIKAEYLHKEDFREFKADLFNALNEIRRDVRRLLDFKDST